MCLLQKILKTFEKYINFSKYIYNINSNILKLDSAVFIADYEIGLRKSITISFPKSILFGCWFHFSQAARRNITTKWNKLVTYLRQDKNESM